MLSWFHPPHHASRTPLCLQATCRCAPLTRAHLLLTIAVQSPYRPLALLHPPPPPGRFLASYDSQVRGPWKYRKACDFLVNTAIGGGIKAAFNRVAGEWRAALERTGQAEGLVAKVGAGAGCGRWAGMREDACIRADGQFGGQVKGDTDRGTVGGQMG